MGLPSISLVHSPPPSSPLRLSTSVPTSHTALLSRDDHAHASVPSIFPRKIYSTAPAMATTGTATQRASLVHRNARPHKNGRGPLAQTQLHTHLRLWRQTSETVFPLRSLRPLGSPPPWCLLQLVPPLRAQRPLSNSRQRPNPRMRRRPNRVMKRHPSLARPPLLLRRL